MPSNNPIDKPLADCGLNKQDCRENGYCEGHVLHSTPSQADELREIEDLREYLKAAYLGAMRSDATSLTDASSIAFADYATLRMQSLIQKAHEDGYREAISDTTEAIQDGRLVMRQFITKKELKAELTKSKKERE